MAQDNIDCRAVIARHPLPWKVNEDYRKWLKAGTHAQSPEAILDANGNGVIGASEWLHMESDVADMIVFLANKYGPHPS